MKKVLLVCGAAAATSAMVERKLEKILAEEGIKAKLVKTMALEVKSHSRDADLIIATTQVPDNLGVPVVIGIPFLTGINEEATIQEILSYLREE